ncbi:hypothetical protein [Bacillus sinesaloumensis]|uniref:hypothetical protein n=1 Tax=Litchfieldia sinesaloumensis TaxID=1926280 RepID=UPI00114FED0F|nr:hypothetical protein [Bacillus sinesaloumensis]
MKHFKSEEWLLYIKDELAEVKREELENHLFSCDQCLEVYMSLIENQAEELPDIVNASFTDDVILKLLIKKENQKRSFLQSPIFHYGVAAAVTLTLMSTGVFQSMTSILGTVEASSFAKERHSVSDNLMEKALSLFNIIDIQEEGEK